MRRSDVDLRLLVAGHLVEVQAVDGLLPVLHGVPDGVLDGLVAAADLVG
jgi:hypothetical protein